MEYFAEAIIGAITGVVITGIWWISEFYYKRHLKRIRDEHDPY